MMQANLHYNGKKVDDFLDLLDPETNLRIAAQILRTGLNKYPEDIERGIGFYHSNEEKRARLFGEMIISTASHLID
jgi:hypothetical protein